MQRKVLVDVVRFTATKPRAMLRSTPDLLRKAPNKPVRYQREEADMGVAWYRGSLVWSDILGAPVQGGYQQ